MPKTVRRVELFISAPSDVAAERQAAVEVAEQLNVLSHVSSRYHLVPHAYEDAAPPVVGQAPQSVVDEYMLHAGDADLFVCILWRRFGTPFTQPETGQQFDSGTEYEFLAAHRAHGLGKRPIMLLYRCVRDPEEDPPSEQAEKVDAFFGRFEGADAQYQGLIKMYEDVNDFRTQLLRDLDRVIAQGALEDERSPVTLMTMLSNDGWTLTFHVPELLTEILYRMDDATEFKSTGHTNYSDPSTGQPVANPTVSLGVLTGQHTAHVKYVDRFGVTKGPYALDFDVMTETIKQSKQGLNHVYAWLAFGLHGGKLLVYFSHLLSYKAGMEEIRYSVDSADLREQLAFVPWTNPGTASIAQNDPVYVAIPKDSEFVTVQVVYKDGTLSEARRFDVPTELVEAG